MGSCILRKRPQVGPPDRPSGSDHREGGFLMRAHNRARGVQAVFAVAVVLGSVLVRGKPAWLGVAAAPKPDPLPAGKDGKRDEAVRAAVRTAAHALPAPGRLALR